MWMPMRDEPVEKYARFLLKRHGNAAMYYAHRMAGRLQAQGDLAGYSIWSRVADAVERRLKSDLKTSDLEPELQPANLDS
jgi:hypothetical protein